MSPKKKTPQEPVWVTCEACEDWYCALHDLHVWECDCPPIEEWHYDPRTGIPYDAPEKPQP